MAVAEKLVVRTADGYPLAATLWLSGAAGAPSRYVVVNAGAGIPARYYDRFAAWLADRGVPTLTYDYRGIAASAPPVAQGLRGTRRRLGKQGLCRCAGQLVAAVSPLAKPRCSGHSIGGFVTGLMPGGERIERLALVGTHTGYWRDYARRVRLPMFFTWHLAMPLVVRTIGYVPARRFGLPEDLPAGVARDWSARRRPEPWWNLRRPDGTPTASASPA